MKEAIIEWKDFSFRYETQQEPTLQGIDLTIYKGEKVLIVGPYSQGVNTYIGLPMNIVALGVFVIVFALIWKKERTTLRFLLGSLAGTIGLTLAMLVLNYVYAVPLYAKFANFDIGKILGLSNYLMTMVLPFNLIEGVIFSVSFWLLYVLLKPTLKHYER